MIEVHFEYETFVSVLNDKEFLANLSDFIPC